jgi:NAD(P)-dependent dehydrogenase (short-subunit alcohol dehydrogenase family)
VSSAMTTDSPADQKRGISPQKLSDRVTDETGARSGMGKAIALSLASEGAQACLVGRKLDTLEDLAKTVQQDSLRARACRADLTRDENIRARGGHGRALSEDAAHLRGYGNQQPAGVQI